MWANKYDCWHFVSVNKNMVVRTTWTPPKTTTVHKQEFNLRGTPYRTDDVEMSADEKKAVNVSADHPAYLCSLPVNTEACSTLVRIAERDVSLHAPTCLIHCPLCNNKVYMYFSHAGETLRCWYCHGQFDIMH